MKGVMSAIQNSHLPDCPLLDGVPIICINLLTRVDRKQECLAKIPYKFRFYHVPIHEENGWKGCYQSHLDVITWAKQQQLEHVFIVEDDIVQLRGLETIPAFPVNFDMIYLGGICLDIIGTWWQEWTQGRIVCMHAYIVPKHFYDVILEHCMKDYEQPQKPIDAFLCDSIHARYQVYMLTDPAYIQGEDWSDIDLKIKWRQYKWPRAGEWCQNP